MKRSQSTERASTKVLAIGALEGLKSVPPLDLATLGPEEPLPSLEGFDAVLLDGALSGPRLTALFLGLSAARERPAAVVVAPPESWGNLKRSLGDEADAFAEMGGRDLAESIASGLETRALKKELREKTARLSALGEELAQAKLRMADELRLAGSVQRSLHPPPRRHPRLDIGREFIPVHEIGGDYYDFVPLDAETLVFGIGDVMGKGVPAALLAANLKASLRAQLQTRAVRPEECLRKVNQLFWEVAPKGHFSSLFLGVFRLDERRLDYANAGHPPPFLVRGSEAVDLKEAGTALGLEEESGYNRGEIALAPEDVIVFFSDGVTDRPNGVSELFGLERLKKCALGSRGDPARITLYSILGDLQGWSGGRPAEDDMTLVVTKVL